MAHAGMTEAVGGEVAQPPRRRSLLASIEHFLGLLVEIPAAILVIAEIVILFAGVVARYGMHRPLIWSDELASILFLWLSLLGAYVALRRGEHMRMTGLVSRAGPRLGRLLEAFATTASLAFLLMVLRPAIEHAEDEAIVLTPALEVSSAWRVAALPVGIGLMIVAALFRLVRLRDWHAVTIAALATIAVIRMCSARRNATAAPSMASHRNRIDPSSSDQISGRCSA